MKYVFLLQKKFDCLLISKKEGLVIFKDKLFYTSSILSQNYIFTLAAFQKQTKAYSEFVTPQDIDMMIKIKLEDLTAFSATEIEKKKIKKRSSFILLQRYFIDKIMLNFTSWKLWCIFIAVCLINSSYSNLQLLKINK
jgi:hypothetical protein